MVGHTLNFISVNRRDEALCLFIPLPSPCLCIYWEGVHRTALAFTIPVTENKCKLEKKTKILDCGIKNV